MQKNWKMIISIGFVYQDTQKKKMAMISSPQIVMSVKLLQLIFYLIIILEII